MSPLEADLRTGRAALDRYLEQGYRRVRGMSSRFAAAICGWLLAHQAGHGIAGDALELGCFEGRFLIALGLALEPGERVVGLDGFDWPDDRVHDRLVANCAAHGLEPERWRAHRARTTELDAAGLARLLEGRRARFVHVDGDHSPEVLRHDLDLAAAVVDDRGLLCLDDMLHPVYPFLVVAVRDWLAANPGWLVTAVLDREDTVGSAKFLLCRREAAALYERALMDRYPLRHLVLGGDALGHHCVVLTLEPRLAEL